MSDQQLLPPDRGPRIAVAVAGVGGLAALGFGLQALGVALVLAAVAGGLATSVGPVLTRRSVRMRDIVVPRWTGADDQALATDQRRLLAQLADPAQVAGAVRPRVASLVADRLAHRSIEPGSAEARTLLGEPLVAFLTDGGRRPVSASAFGALLDRVEAL